MPISEMYWRRILAGLLLSFLPASLAGLPQAFAGEADVLAVKVSPQGDGAYLFEVTVRHADTGWEHYANRWDVLGPNGEVLATRTLAHPHENEQPFTRSLPGVRIPEGVAAVTVRAHDSVHGYGGAEMQVEVPRN